MLYIYLESLTKLDFPSPFPLSRFAVEETCGVAARPIVGCDRGS
jgi:hypothetical protein